MENTYGVWQATSNLEPNDIRAEGILENLLTTLVARIACDWYPNHKVNILTRNSLRNLLDKRRKRKYNIIKTDKGIVYETKYVLATECINNNYQHFYDKRVYKNKINDKSN